MKQLVVERPNEEPEIYPWNDGIIKRFKFDEFEVHRLNTDQIVWRGDVAFSVEESE